MVVVVVVVVVVLLMMNDEAGRKPWTWTGPTIRCLTVLATALQRYILSMLCRAMNLFNVHPERDRTTALHERSPSVSTNMQILRNSTI